MTKYVLKSGFPEFSIYPGFIHWTVCWATAQAELNYENNSDP